LKFQTEPIPARRDPSGAVNFFVAGASRKEKHSLSAIANCAKMREAFERRSTGYTLGQLRSMGIYYFDAKPANIAFAE